MSTIVQLAPVPNLTEPITASNWYAWDIYLRAQDMATKQINADAQAIADAAWRVEVKARDLDRTAAMREQAAAMLAAVNTPHPAATDADLIHCFMSSLAADWGAASRGSASVIATAQGMLVEYRKKFPLPVTP
jgi:hypothetical protein